MFIVHGEPRVKVNCVATNYPEIIASKNADGTFSEREVDDWRVTCTITEGEKKVFSDDLKIPHPTPFREAMDAIDQFRKVRAVQILKEKNSK